MTAERRVTGMGVAGEPMGVLGDELAAWLTRRNAAAIVGEDREAIGV